MLTPSQVDNLVDTYREIVSMYKGACTLSQCFSLRQKIKKSALKYNIDDIKSGWVIIIRRMKHCAPSADALTGGQFSGHI